MASVVPLFVCQALAALTRMRRMKQIEAKMR